MKISVLRVFLFFMTLLIFSCSKEKEKDIIVKEYIVIDSGSIFGEWKMAKKARDGKLRQLNEYDSTSTNLYTTDSVIFFTNGIRTGSKGYELRSEYDSTRGQIKLIKLIDIEGNYYDLQYDIFRDTLYLRLNWSPPSEEWHVRL